MIGKFLSFCFVIALAGWMVFVIDGNGHCERAMRLSGPVQALTSGLDWVTRPWSHDWNLIVRYQGLRLRLYAARFLHIQIYGQGSPSCYFDEFRP